MKKIIFLMTGFLLFSTVVHAALKMGPYLQNINTQSVIIAWEDDSTSGSYLKYGKDENNLDQSVYVSAYLDVRRSWWKYVYHKQLKDLDPGTLYYYRVGNGKIYTFKTAPLVGKGFNFAVYSDTQWNPNVHEHIAKKGFKQAFKANDLSELKRNLSFVLVSGDLVHEGEKVQQYRERFFDPIGELKSLIPFYPAVGNHEYQGLSKGENPIYFDYFRLPDNGSKKSRGHWYSFKYLNSVFISLNTNIGSTTGFRHHPVMYNEEASKEQMIWFEKELTRVCKDKDIDFVFSFFHHPVFSELWVPGTEPYAQKIAKKLERHYHKCDKAGAIFSGHTHAYSRGQALESPLYYVIVATAGGRLDTWGEYENKDYPEIQKSISSFGFVSINVTTGKNAKFHIKRHSFGNDPLKLGAFYIEDDFQFIKGAKAPARPTVNKVLRIGDVLQTSASNFSAGDNNRHLETQWRIKLGRGSEQKIVWKDWKRFENIYEGRNTAKNTDLTKLKTPFTMHGLEPFYIQVRYRDANLTWSEWSVQKKF